MTSQASHEPSACRNRNNTGVGRESMKVTVESKPSSALGLVVGMHQIERVGPDQLAVAIAQQARGAVAHVAEPALAVDDRDHVGQLAQDRALEPVVVPVARHGVPALRPQHIPMAIDIPERPVKTQMSAFPATAAGRFAAAQALRTSMKLPTNMSAPAATTKV